MQYKLNLKSPAIIDNRRIHAILLFLHAIHALIKEVRIFFPHCGKNDYTFL